MSGADWQAPPVMDHRVNKRSRRQQESGPHLHSRMPAATNADVSPERRDPEDTRRTMTLVPVQKTTRPPGDGRTGHRGTVGNHHRGVSHGSVAVRIRRRGLSNIGKPERASRCAPSRTIGRRDLIGSGATVSRAEVDRRDSVHGISRVGAPSAYPPRSGRGRRPCLVEIDWDTERTI
jgi:hypothetical protein